MSYVAIFQRIRDISVEGMINEIATSAEDGITAIIDSSCFKITEIGDWLSTKWKGKRKGWSKMHIAIDSGSMNVVSLTITDEHSSDSLQFRNVVDPIASRTGRVYGDGGYDSKYNFNYLHENGIDAVILPRKNAATMERGSPYRAKIVRRIRKIGLESWKHSLEYGKRWRVEIFFSALKRVMGEVIRAKKLEYQIQEAVMKVYSFFLMRKNNTVR